MPQLDTSTWSTTILTMIISLFMFLQLKMLTHLFFPYPQTANMEITKQNCPWEKKWTKIYSPLSPHLMS
uniref:ATP synthase F0 subunit 8 n=1 Tax=Cuniculus paca TaxID=108852 RepID=UPI002551E305|nr:ATP synthase F0 subunit 8 [Cuniculus paca]WGU49255.1 ATP synthase F0 subunit 8 [Cuniculus paca]